MIDYKKLTKVFVAFAIALVALISSGSAVAPTPSYGSAVVDGQYGEWELANDYFADMIRAGGNGGQTTVESKLYLRYDCTNQVMYTLVLVEPGVQAIESTGDAWVAIDGNQNKVIFSQFSWVYDANGIPIGWESSFDLAFKDQVARTGIYELLVHTQVFDDGASQTSATDRYTDPDGIPLTIDCSGGRTGEEKYDLYLEKSGPEYIFVDDTSITYTMKVGNNGPSSVNKDAITITDNGITVPFKEEGGYVVGDVNMNNLLDQGELWEATYTTFVSGLEPDTYITNTACVTGPDDKFGNGDTNTANNCDDASVYVWWKGYTPGYWKNHPEAWLSPYTTTTTIGSFFTSAPPSLQSNNFMTALGYKGGTGTIGATQILLRAAVAAVMNENQFGNGYPPHATTSDLIAAVNTALATNDRATMLDLATKLDKWNNGYHP